MSRLSTMVLMGIKLPLEAVMRQIASGIDILVHLGRLRDKSRKVLEIMEVLGYELGDKAEVKREIDTVIAAKKMEFQIMSVIPLGIIGYMRLSFPEFMAGLYGNLPGAAFMSICLGAYIAAWRLGCKIVEIEV